MPFEYKNPCSIASPGMFKSIQSTYLRSYNLICTCYAQITSQLWWRKKRQMCLLKSLNFDYRAATLTWQIGTKLNVFVFFLKLYCFCFNIIQKILKLLLNSYMRQFANGNSFNKFYETTSSATKRPLAKYRCYTWVLDGIFLVWVTCWETEVQWHSSLNWM